MVIIGNTNAYMTEDVESLLVWMLWSRSQSSVLLWTSCLGISVAMEDWLLSSSSGSYPSISSLLLLAHLNECLLSWFILCQPRLSSGSESLKLSPILQVSLWLIFWLHLLTQMEPLGDIFLCLAGIASMIENNPWPWPASLTWSSSLLFFLERELLISRESAAPWKLCDATPLSPNDFDLPTCCFGQFSQESGQPGVPKEEEYLVCCLISLSERAIPLYASLGTPCWPPGCWGDLLGWLSGTWANYHKVYHAGLSITTWEEDQSDYW